MKHALAVDIGGTFTDVVLATSDGATHIHKLLTDRGRPDRGVIKGILEILQQHNVDPALVERIVHGTTLATNTVLEQSGPLIAFVTTLGFGDLLHIGREARVEEDRYDLSFSTGEPPLPRSMVFEVAERIGARGETVRDLDERQVSQVVSNIAATQPAAVAICLLHAYANPSHEQRVAALLRRSLPPNAQIVCSSDVLPEMREYERAATTLISAYVAPVMQGYLDRLQAGLREIGVHAPLQIMESSGGVMTAHGVATRAVATIESGGAAGVVAAASLARRDGLPMVLSFDMGGTTAKVAVVKDGQPRLTHDLHVGGRGSFGGRRAGTGIPVRIPAIDLAEVGVGGGSIAWIAEDGILRVGPKSAGSDPGPACYGLGGTEPTVTDADLVLGYLNPSSLAGGALRLDAEAGFRAVERHLADPLSVDLAASAWAVYALVNANMALAIDVVTVQRGIDPRDFIPVAFGGAGPMHMIGVAEEFGISSLVAPYGAGVNSALGMLDSDLMLECSSTYIVPMDLIDPVQIELEFDSLLFKGLRQMGFDEAPTGLLIERLVDVRYLGQAHSLTVPIANEPFGDASVKRLTATFRSQFDQEFGVDRDAPTEMSALRLRLSLPVERTRDPVVEPRLGRDAGIGSRKAYFGPASADIYVDTAIYKRDALEPGDRFSGPAIIEGLVDTVVVPPGWAAAVDTRLGIRLTRL
jgi:N-methylhydantoinase A